MSLLSRIDNLVLNTLFFSSLYLVFNINLTSFRVLFNWPSIKPRIRPKIKDINRFAIDIDITANIIKSVIDNTGSIISY